MMPEDKGRRRGNREQRFGDALFGGIQRALMTQFLGKLDQNTSVRWKAVFWKYTCDTHGSAFYHILRVSSGADAVFPCCAASSY